MSDIGKYDAMEAEVIAAIGVIDGVATVKVSTSVEDLIERNGIQMPAIGIIEGDATYRAPYAIANRRLEGCVEWEVAVVTREARGKVSARAVLRAILETIRDRVHYTQSALSPRFRYMWKGDKRVQVEGDDLCAAVATFELTALLQ